MVRVLARCGRKREVRYKNTEGIKPECFNRMPEDLGLIQHCPIALSEMMEMFYNLYCPTWQRLAT